ncbi:mevalonate diphosphate decarboxylase isoform X2 [Rhodnius prolixus]|uniref:mevalonate diphosphate decarboxylase isoform X2 n=1 Tax=Rhodnius prolixus TaxID=13249 RepID=UPI003D18BDA6
MTIITCLAPVNIAVIKYWGKRDERLILPLNDSVSATLSINQMHATTTIFTSTDLSEDRIWLNGKEESFDESSRLLTCINEIRKKAAEKERECLNSGIETEDRSKWKVHVCSENNFPTGAGLASSAAGYACFVYCLTKVLNVDCEVSSVARLGSGSACRSVLGGFVRWHRGLKGDGSDSLAEQIVPAEHWPTLRIVILVVSDHKKKVSSTSGMQRSVETSELLKFRVSTVVPRRTEEIIKAIERKDFHSFAELTMKDSNQLHSVCLDTYPPAVYMNDVSHAIVDFVHKYNKLKGSSNKLAYTFDAGPNACLFTEEEHLSEVIALIKRVFPPLSDDNFVRGLPVQNKQIDADNLLLPSCGPHEPGLLKYILSTKLGDGPTVVSEPGIHLLDDKGLPKKQLEV